MSEITVTEYEAMLRRAERAEAALDDMRRERDRWKAAVPETDPQERGLGRLIRGCGAP